MYLDEAVFIQGQSGVEEPLRRAAVGAPDGFRKRNLCTRTEMEDIRGNTEERGERDGMEKYGRGGGEDDRGRARVMPGPVGR